MHIYQSTNFQEFYEPWGITYKGLRLLDVPQTNIALHFNDITEFIDAALTGGGKVLVNCEMGMSRSSTCVLAYLMLKHKMTAGDALAKVGCPLSVYSTKAGILSLQVRKHRYVRPNKGFLRQLYELDTRLERERLMMVTK